MAHSLHSMILMDHFYYCKTINYDVFYKKIIEKYVNYKSYFIFDPNDFLHKLRLDNFWII